MLRAVLQFGSGASLHRPNFGVCHLRIMGRRARQMVATGPLWAGCPGEQAGSGQEEEKRGVDACG